MTEGIDGLRSLSLNGRYRSNLDDVVEGFYIPCLSAASTYSRAVGYFTSTSMALFARGLKDFADRGGSMRLIASPHLDADDILDIDRGYDLRQVLERATLREIQREEDDDLRRGLGLVGRLIAEGRLDIKLAFVERQGRIGIYHEKIGVFRDGFGDLVAFTGSANETMGGLLANFESVEVYRGWVPGDGERSLRIEADFEDLWNNRTENLSVELFPSVSRDRLIELGRDYVFEPEATDTSEELQSFTSGETSVLSLPSTMTVRGYQRDAVESWLRNRGRGMFKMATGTGKTKTALVAATQLCQVLRDREQPLIILIVAPLQHLVDQWIEEVELFGVRPIAVYESSQRWIVPVEEQLAEARLGHRPVVALVATNASFAGERFQSVLSRIVQPILIIGDEAHNLGSPTSLRALPSHATYRLALSATPERWFDEDGTEALSEYFGKVVYELGLEDAIRMGALSPYQYVPRIVELTENETVLYADLTNRIARCLAQGESLGTNDASSPLGNLLRKRAGVLGHAERKLAFLKADLGARSDQWHQLVYCAEGNRPTDAGDEAGANQLAEVMDMTGNDLGLSAHSYVYETSRSDRRNLLRRFGTGDDLRVLVAMRCLDEGVDIPDARVGYLLASSSNPRQFIQRRGRLLRPADGKERAEIVDYIAVPAQGSPINFDVERRLLARELERVHEFGRLAQNYGSTLETLRPLKEKYHLMHM